MQPIAKSHCGTAMNQVKSSVKQTRDLMFTNKKAVPIVAVDYVFINPDYREDAEKWLKEEREKIITKKEVEKI
ncbi:MAG: hypothetical protein OIN86_07375 [Candidatus Methanoperedens sp.]|nr:hypothetical protein [Candidatus Methanoperedens sp.]